MQFVTRYLTSYGFLIAPTRQTPKQLSRRAGVCSSVSFVDLHCTISEVLVTVDRICCEFVCKLGSKTKVWSKKKAYNCFYLSCSILIDVRCFHRAKWAKSLRSAKSTVVCRSVSDSRRELVSSKSLQTRNTCCTDSCHRLLLHRKTIICETINIISSFLPRSLS